MRTAPLVCTAVLILLVRLLAPSSSFAHADADDARQVARGEAVYREHCASCHGANLEGEPNWNQRKPSGRLPAPPHDASGHTWHHTDDQLFRVTKMGMKPPVAPAGYESDMPAFEGVLSDDDIWAALAFIKSRWPANIRARHKARDGGSKGGHRH